MVQIPYFAPNPPHPLPRNSEIENAPVLEDHNGYKHVQIGAKFVVKFGHNLRLSLIEGENMIFVQETTRIKVPEVYALYTDVKSSTNYIVMEYIEGQTLDTLWETLSDSGKEEITANLKRYFTELRQLSSPGYFGALDKRPLLGGVFWTPEPNLAINGPFDTESDLNEAFALKYIAESEYLSIHRANFYRRALSNVFQNHNPKFTHGDFQRKNVIVKCRNHEISSDCGGPMYEVTLIDWETSGWYPSYWEYSMAGMATRWDDDWSGWLRCWSLSIVNTHGCECYIWSCGHRKKARQFLLDISTIRKDVLIECFIVIYQITIPRWVVPDDLIRSLSINYLWSDTSEPESDIWKRVIWYNRRGKMLPKELRYMEEKDL